MQATARLPALRIPDVVKRSKRYQHTLFTLYYLKGVASPQFAFIVSTKVDKKAVVRNRIKRRLRSACQQYIDTTAGGEYVVIVRSAELATIDYTQLQSALNTALSNVTR